MKRACPPRARDWACWCSATLKSHRGRPQSHDCGYGAGGHLRWRGRRARGEDQGVGGWLADRGEDHCFLDFGGSADLAVSSDGGGSRGTARGKPYEWTVLLNYGVWGPALFRQPETVGPERPFMFICGSFYIGSLYIGGNLPSLKAKPEIGFCGSSFAIRRSNPVDQGWQDPFSTILALRVRGNGFLHRIQRC